MLSRKKNSVIDIIGEKYGEIYMEIMENSVKDMNSSNTQQFYMKETSSYYTVVDKMGRQDGSTEIAKLLSNSEFIFR